MRKKITILTGILLIFLVSCGNKSGSGVKEAESKGKAESSESVTEKSEKENSEPVVEVEPKQFLDLLLGALISTFRSGDAEKIKALSSELTEEEIESVLLFKEAYKKLEYRITDEKTVGDNRILTVRIRAVDLEDIADETIKAISDNPENFTKLSEEEQKKLTFSIMKKIIEQKVADSHTKMIEKTFDIKFEKRNSEWVIAEDGEYEKMYIFMSSFGMEQGQP